MNEAAGYRLRPSLNKDQIRQAEAAVFGLPESIVMSPQFTHEEIEKMRAMVLQHDTTHNRMREFDLNNPPKEPYVYREFPRLMYDNAGNHKVANNPQEMQKLTNAGYLKVPLAPLEVKDIPLTASDAAEAQHVDEAIQQLKRGPGRPRKETTDQQI